jgi:cellulose 1,4-beta-cellobiosidase
MTLMPMAFVAVFLCLVSRPAAQQAGHMEQEGNPTITLKECTNAGGCVAQEVKVVLDANWRWVHSTSGYENCYTGDTWNSQLCPDGASCARNCALEGVSHEKYENTYGISKIDNGFKIRFVTDHQYGTNVGGRLYLLDGDDKYMMFYLKNREFSIDIDVSNLHCGMNGAMYFVEMDQYGGKGKNNNQAGAKFGTGYCDAQCPHDIKFIDGEANVRDWKPNPKDKSNNMGTGHYGSCCAEMDIWEANSMATAYTPHPCNIDGQLRCENIACGDTDKGQRYQGVCDKDGCDINPFRMGNETFYGRGPQFVVDTTKPMTLVTQFITDDGTDVGQLSEIRRFYVQDGKRIYSPPAVILESSAESITDGFCEEKKALFDDVNDYKAKGGSAAMGESLDRGHVMVFSLWDDVEVNMLWLDSCFPLDKECSDPGVHRGTCPGGEFSTPTYLRQKYPDGWTSFANVAVGEIGSTLQEAPTPPPTPAPSGCFPSPGKNQPECLGQSEARCKFMHQYENKCQWVPQNTFIPTPVPTSAPTFMSAPTPAPTFASMTATTTKSAAGNCAKWCTTHSKPWVKKCSWKKCAGCSECNAATTTTSTMTTVAVCKPWCIECPMDWTEKCGWPQLCGGCPQCESGGNRRLRGKDGEFSNTVVHV